MNDKFMECVTNPIKSRILYEISSKGEVTAKQLAEIHSDIPHATLYRYLRKMTADNILKVVKENQIRGTVEKVYAIVDDLLVDIKKMLDENNGQAYMMLFSNFIIGLMEEFKGYTSHADINLLEDGSGFNTTSIYATTGELQSAMIEIIKILTPLAQNEKTPERSLHSIAIITTPPKRVKK
ncbi:MAG: DNA-binding protein [Clostridiales bacterium]|jgi:DNA-binding HxlR family transcriptional regulator|nr:DNA-binding protein [Clostridiales bacterium]